MLALGSCLCASSEAPFETVRKRLHDNLAREGFELIGETDVTEHLREALGVAIEQYVVVVALQPRAAYDAIQIWRGFGLFSVVAIALYDAGPFRLAVVTDPGTDIEQPASAELQDVACRLRRSVSRVLAIEDVDAGPFAGVAGEPPAEAAALDHAAIIALSAMRR
jgi:uncharacterized protein (DUF302 family)